MSWAKGRVRLGQARPRGVGRWSAEQRQSRRRVAEQPAQILGADAERGAGMAADETVEEEGCFIACNVGQAGKNERIPRTQDKGEGEG